MVKLGAYGRPECRRFEQERRNIGYAACSTCKGAVAALCLPFSVLAAFGIMLLSKAETIVVEKVSTVVVDVFAPIMDVLSRPAAAVNDAVKTVRGLADLRDENIRLARENERLLVWQEAARRLASQNQALQSLLDFKPGPNSQSIATRVIADSGGAFVRSSCC